MALEWKTTGAAASAEAAGPMAAAVPWPKAGMLPFSTLGTMPGMAVQWRGGGCGGAVPGGRSGAGEDVGEVAGASTEGRRPRWSHGRFEKQECGREGQDQGDPNH